MNIHQVEALLLQGKKRPELPEVNSINFTKVLSVIDKRIKISLFLKTKKVKDYISLLAKEENLMSNDYFCSVGIGRNAKTWIDTRIATYLVSELSTKFKYHLINSLIMTNNDIILECKKVPKMALSKKYRGHGKIRDL
jgi:hypothetical protein